MRSVIFLAIAAALFSSCSTAKKAATTAYDFQIAQSAPVYPSSELNHVAVREKHTEKSAYTALSNVSNIPLPNLLKKQITYRLNQSTSWVVLLQQPIEATNAQSSKRVKNRNEFDEVGLACIGYSLLSLVLTIGVAYLLKLLGVMVPFEGIILMWIGMFFILYFAITGFD